MSSVVFDAAQKGGEAVKAGPIGLAVILILCIACYFLFKSMSRHMRNVRENFPVDAPAAPTTSPTTSPKTSLVKPVATLADPQATAADPAVGDVAPTEPDEPRREG